MVKYPMTSDTIFKKVLEDMEIVSYVIELVTGIKLNPKDLMLLPQEINNNVDNKKSLLDVRVSYKEEYQINLEMQKNKVVYSMIDRVIYYADMMNVKGTPKGKDYLFKKIISICFIGFEDEKCRGYLEKYQFQSEGMPYIKLDNKRIYIIDMRKTREIDKWELRRLIELMKDKEVEKYREDGDMMEKISKAIEEANMDEVAAYNEMQRIKAENDYNISMAISREEGLAEGEARTQTKVVLAAHKNGADVEFISKITNLSVSKVQEIIFGK